MKLTPVGKSILILNNNKMLPCVSRCVAFTIKNIGIIILFACLVGWLDSSPIEILKKIRQNQKNCFGLGRDYENSWTWAGLNMSACASAIACVLTRATILGTLCIYF